MKPSTAHLLCLVLRSVIGLWECGGGRKCEGSLHSCHLLHPQNLLGPQRAPTPFLPPLEKALWFCSQNPGMNLRTVLCPLSIMFVRESCCCSRAVCFPGVPVGGTDPGWLPWWHLQPYTVGTMGWHRLLRYSVQVSSSWAILGQEKWPAEIILNPANYSIPESALIFFQVEFSKDRSAFGHSCFSSWALSSGTPEDVVFHY